MNYILSLIIINLIITLLDYNYLKKNKQKISEINYLKQKFHLKIKQKNQKRNSILISIVNGFIISLVSNFVYYANIPYIISFPIAFLLLILLIIIFYHYILAKILK